MWRLMPSWGQGLQSMFGTRLRHKPGCITLDLLRAGHEKGSRRMASTQMEDWYAQKLCTRSTSARDVHHKPDF